MALSQYSLDIIHMCTTSSAVDNVLSPTTMKWLLQNIGLLCTTFFSDAIALDFMCSQGFIQGGGGTWDFPPPLPKKLYFIHYDNQEKLIQLLSILNLYCTKAQSADWALQVTHIDI